VFNALNDTNAPNDLNAFFATDPHGQGPDGFFFPPATCRRQSAARCAQQAQRVSAAGELFFHCRRLSGNEKEKGFSLRPLRLCGETSL
jgi:hypothetical protein